ncbi:nucleotide triphosphate diphosphatase NUDT15 [Erwinia sorbitola]|uniref:NUDIX domain-containing protein n=1 Tax=Erwinia sorbitola TaxID=2681984 RepID=A0A6I6EM27_9GAMM|nr:NUDIX hydrolase [Erwinia sorbitola]MTD29055.1 NUDIX domain-containing protein [Erwinia sorbitola]QGU89205.1 NUDIX domain-containing protein [Erwinia sorbitola]
MEQPRIGVGVLIFRDGKLLLGKRKGSHGAGDWATPGGHLEFGETPQQCAQREAAEETGLLLGECVQGPYTNNIFCSEQKHYVTLFMLAFEASGTPQRCEPDKCEGWQWFDPAALPQPLFAPLNSLRESVDLAALSKQR